MKMLPVLLLLGWCCVGAAGCGGYDDNHTPPPGMGSILVRNNTGDDIYVYFDGQIAGDRADYGSATAYDLPPGNYRVALTERRGWRSWADFVDVLQGRVTYLDVAADPYNSYAYDVAIFFN